MRLSHFRIWLVKGYSRVHCLNLDHGIGSAVAMLFGMKTLLLILALSSNAMANIVYISENTAIGAETVHVTESAIGSIGVYFTSTTLGADCILYVANSPIGSDQQIYITDRSIGADYVVSETASSIGADIMVYVSNTSIVASDRKCGFAAALLPKYRKKR